MNEFKFTTEYEKLIKQRNVNLDFARFALEQAAANAKIAEMLWRGQMEKDPVASAETLWSSLPPIHKVIQNPPATIVFWADNTKTVVKCMEGDTFDPEKGLAMAVCKRLWGQKGEGADYIHVFRKYAKQAPKSEETSFADAIKKLAEEVTQKVKESDEPKQKPWDEVVKGID